ncbi:MAG TPA: hypothetical protein VFV87_02420 [Pirellulaceae bacterium]|nr:hypothetical protein [Pirellulaceae bacterium]
MKPDQPAPRPVNLTLWIMVAVLIWGGYLAIGAVRAGGNLPSLRGLIIFVCTLIFLGLWWLAIAFRARRAAAVVQDEEDSGAHSA